MTDVVKHKSRKRTVGSAALTTCGRCGNGGLVFDLNSSASGPVPEGMVWIRAVEFLMRSEEPMFRDAQPIHRVSVGPRC